MLELPRFFKKQPSSETLAPKIAVEDCLPDPDSRRRVLIVAKTAQQAMKDSGLNVPVVIFGKSSITGKTDTGINLFLDVVDLNLRDFSTGKRIYSDVYDQFLNHFKNGLESNNQLNPDEQQIQIRDFGDRSNPFVPKFKYGHGIEIRANAINVVFQDQSFPLT